MEESMQKTVIVLAERTSVGMMILDSVMPPDLSPRRMVNVSPARAFANLVGYGYTRLYRADDYTIVVGVSEVSVTQETLKGVCVRALGQDQITRFASRTELSSFQEKR